MLWGLIDTFLIYLIPAGLLCVIFATQRNRKEKSSLAILDQEQKLGLTEPNSLHPVIDPVKCVGCSACVKACPENNVLGIIHGKAQLIGPTHCIGHGACKTACPMDAISLVFGTEKRGVDIPHIQPNFETNIPGIFIAGELGGMGLIRNAVSQGRQAVDSIRKMKGMGKPGMHDLVIVGAGPSGFTASLAAMEHKLKFVTLEQETLGGTVSHYPRGKIVMTTPVVLPLVGKMNFRETTKESLLEFWLEVEKKTKIKINYKERVASITPSDKGFVVKTQKETYRTRAVLLSIGRRGTPRKLGVPGEENPKVVYRLIDAEQYRGKHVLVVGGGDSALEAAISISEQPGTTVTISYRSEAFARAKQKNRDKVSQAENDGQMKVLFKSQVRNIADTHVEINHDENVLNVRNDAIIVCVGGILPTPFLKEVGINVETKYGTR
jgi:thioredoxin reductase/Pyruvate/2-oxoacid:ferredoxin oxidoreductase delta subunit